MHLAHLASPVMVFSLPLLPSAAKEGATNASQSRPARPVNINFFIVVDCCYRLRTGIGRVSHRNCSSFEADQQQGTTEWRVAGSRLRPRENAQPGKIRLGARCDYAEFILAGEGPFGGRLLR